MEDQGPRGKRMRRSAIALAVGAGCFAVVAASAASLGGVTSSNLGADTAVVASCDTDGVSVSYTSAYDASVGRYQTTAASITGINTACNGKTLAITLRDVSNASLASGTATVTAGAASVTFSGVGANAASVVGAGILISG